MISIALFGLNCYGFTNTFLKIGDALLLCKIVKGSYQIANLILLGFTISCILF